MKSKPENRIFLELANNKVTPEWVANKYKARGVDQPPFEQISPSIIEAQKEIRIALNYLNEGRLFSETTFPILFSFKERPLFSLKEHAPLDLDGSPITHAIIDEDIDHALKDINSQKYSFIAAEASQYFLDFLENSIEKVRRCQHSSCRQFFLCTRSDQRFCSDKCRSRFNTDKDVASGKAAQRQKDYRERQKEQPEEIHLGKLVLVKAAKGQGNKDIDCLHYLECLDKAAIKNWPDFSCEACPLKHQ